MVVDDRVRGLLPHPVVPWRTLVVIFVDGQQGSWAAGARASSTLLLSTLLGMCVMAEARDLLMLYLSLELVSIPLRDGRLSWGQPAHHRGLAEVRDLRRPASGVMLYGLSLLYGTDRRHAVRGHPRAPGGRAGDAALLVAAVILAGHELQDRRRAVPLLVPGRLRGRAHAGGRVLLGGPQGGRLRRLVRFFYSTLAAGTPGRRPGA